MHKKLFCRTIYVSYIDISGNSITSIVNLKLPQNLVHFDINNNEVFNLKVDNFVGLEKLHALHILDNRGIIVLPSPNCKPIMVRSLIVSAVPPMQLAEEDFRNGLKAFKHLEHSCMNMATELNIETKSDKELCKWFPNIKIISLNGEMRFISKHLEAKATCFAKNIAEPVKKLFNTFKKDTKEGKSNTNEGEGKAAAMTTDDGPKGTGKAKKDRK